MCWVFLRLVNGYHRDRDLQDCKLTPVYWFITLNASTITLFQPKSQIRLFYKLGVYVQGLPGILFRCWVVVN